MAAEQITRQVPGISIDEPQSAWVKARQHQRDVALSRKVGGEDIVDLPKHLSDVGGQEGERA